MSWKIYGLKLKGDNPIRYIGQTVQTLSNRFANHKSDFRLNTHKANWVKANKLNVEIVLIEDGIESLDEANDREKFWIKYYKDKGNKLTNLTEGGDGRLGHPQTPHQKKTSSIRMKKNNPMKNPEVVKKAADSRRGRKLSKKHRDNISKGVTGTGTKKLIQLSIDGDEIKVWESVTAVSNELGYDLSSIAKACRGKQKTAYGYKWKYKS